MRVIVIESWFSCSEGGRCKRGGRRGCECGVWPVELGFLLNLYHGGSKSIGPLGLNWAWFN